MMETETIQRRRYRRQVTNDPEIKTTLTTTKHKSVLAINLSTGHPVVDVPMDESQLIEIEEFIAENRPKIKSYLEANFDGVDVEMVEAISREVAECVILVRSAKEHDWWEASSVETIISALEKGWQSEVKKILTESKTTTPKMDPRIVKQLLKKPEDRRFYAIVRYLSDAKKIKINPKDVMIIGNHLSRVNDGKERVRALGLAGPSGKHYSEACLRNYLKKARTISDTLR